MSSITPDNTLLGLLAERPRHGYQLLEAFRDPTQLGEVWNLSTSQLYAVLKRLEAQRLITGTTEESPDAPVRTVYVLTQTGRDQLEAWLADYPSASIRQVRVEFLSRLHIARRLNRATGDLIRRQKAACQVAHLSLIDHRNAMEPGIGRLALELHIAQLAAIIDWIDRCEIVPRESA
jgi:DNA-binding PadR family transcriptional regulator